ncbi:MAG: hypothetical protein ACRDH5_14095, partial [bacterium]
GWTAAAVRAPGGYGLLLGREVAPEHYRALLAHEIAHASEGDLFWEPYTDGPARLIVSSLRGTPVLLFPFLPLLLFAVPLARATEVRADRRASAVVPSYPEALKEVARRGGGGPSLLHPSPALRLRVSARDSLINTTDS